VEAFRRRWPGWRLPAGGHPADACSARCLLTPRQRHTPGAEAQGPSLGTASAMPHSTRHGGKPRRRSASRSALCQPAQGVGITRRHPVVSESVSRRVDLMNSWLLVLCSTPAAWLAEGRLTSWVRYGGPVLSRLPPSCCEPCWSTWPLAVPQGDGHQRPTGRVV